MLKECFTDRQKVKPVYLDYIDSACYMSEVPYWQLALWNFDYHNEVCI